MDTEFNTSKKHSHDVNTVERCQQKQTTCKISQHASGFDSQRGLLHGLHGLPWRRCSVYRFFRRASQEMDSMELVDGTPHAPGPSFVSSELTTCFSLFFSFFSHFQLFNCQFATRRNWSLQHHRIRIPRPMVDRQPRQLLKLMLLE